MDQSNIRSEIGDDERNLWSFSEFVIDDIPSSFLKLTMSRRVKDSQISEDRLKEYLQQTVHSAMTRNSSEMLNSSEELVKRLLYGTGSRKAVLIQVCSSKIAEILREELHQKQSELIDRRPIYVEFVCYRSVKEERERLDRIVNASSSRTPDELNQAICGLIVIPDFITREEEISLIENFDANQGSHWKRTVKARQVQHYGYEFNYDTRRCDESTPLSNPMPNPLPELIGRITALSPMKDRPDQVTVNDYQPGQGIAAHIDTHSAFSEHIVSLSLGNAVVMEFTHPDGRREPVVLDPRSLLVMTKASRYEWTHAIPPRPFDLIDNLKVPRLRRISVTFRKVRNAACMCDYPVQCDRHEFLRLQNGDVIGQNKPNDSSASSEQLKQSIAPSIVEKEYVHKFYETVASHFSSTRYKPWPRVAEFVKNLPTGSIIADLGCGNGKYMKCVEQCTSFMLGGDRSEKLVQICNQNGLDAAICDALAFPMRSQSCDAAISIAVLHHLSTYHHRLAAVNEVIRVLRVKGKGVIYAWAHEQLSSSRRKFEESKQDFMVPWHLDPRFTTPKSTVGDENDKRDEGIVVQRYCHMFKEGELNLLVEATGKARVINYYYDESNWAVVLERTN